MKKCVMLFVYLFVYFIITNSGSGGNTICLSAVSIVMVCSDCGPARPCGIKNEPLVEPYTDNQLDKLGGTREDGEEAEEVEFEDELPLLALLAEDMSMGIIA